MILRNLGRSGLRVSLVGLGCNNFGGRMDLRGLARRDPQGARRRHHAVRHRRRLRQSRRLGNRDGRNPRRPPQGHRACLEIRHGDGRRRKEGRLAPLHHGGRGGEPEAAEDRLDRPLPAAPARSAHPDRGDAARARRSRARRQGALHRLLEFHARADRRGAMGGTPSQSQCLRLGAGRIFAAQAQPRRRERSTTCTRYGLGLLPYLSARLRPAHRQAQARRGSRRHAARDADVLQLS